MDLTRLGEEGPAFRLALQFLTRLPIKVGDVTDDELAGSPRWYPGVGIVVGVIAALIYAGAVAIWPPLVAALLSTATGILVTGALHEDGWADTCDGLGGGRTRDRALEIMRDSRVGSYGAIGLVLMLGAKIAVLAALPPAAAPWALIAGHAASRASMLWVMQALPYARDEGAGKAVSAPLDGWGLQVAGATTILALIPLFFAVPFHAFILGLLGLAGGHFALRRRLEQRLDGWTGDTLGAVQQASEIGLLLGLAAFA